MNRIISALCVIALLALGLAACGGSDDSTTETTPAKESSEKTAGGGKEEASGIGPTKVFRANTDEYEEILFDEFGYTLYRFSKDKDSKSTCYGACAKQWPPLLTEGQPKAYAVIPEKLGTTQRRDGTTQVTYFGHPLYTFTGDKKYPTGRVHGHDVEAFGGKWYSLHKNGEDLAH
ncbi:MAG: hypothetical protein M3Y75_01930 [Actinomycetota bacterium]|nr:hypothetical protein [Actinomycetota bacterium]